MASFASLPWNAVKKHFKSSRVKLSFWGGNVYGGKIFLRESFHAGIDTGRFLDYNIEEFIREMGKRIFRKRFPEALKALQKYGIVWIAVIEVTTYLGKYPKIGLFFIKILLFMI